MHRQLRRNMLSRSVNVPVCGGKSMVWRIYGLGRCFQLEVRRRRNSGSRYGPEEHESPQGTLVDAPFQVQWYEMFSHRLPSLPTQMLRSCQQRRWYIRSFHLMRGAALVDIWCTGYLVLGITDGPSVWGIRSSRGRAYWSKLARSHCLGTRTRL